MRLHDIGSMAIMHIWYSLSKMRVEHISSCMVYFKHSIEVLKHETAPGNWYRNFSRNDLVAFTILLIARFSYLSVFEIYSLLTMHLFPYKILSIVKMQYLLVNSSISFKPNESCSTFCYTAFRKYLRCIELIFARMQTRGLARIK